MSRERFEWLERWVAKPEDIIRTPGTESNVKEIYDKCAELERDPHNVILNQFSAFANYLIHYACTGRPPTTPSPISRAPASVGSRPLSRQPGLPAPSLPATG